MLSRHYVRDHLHVQFGHAAVLGQLAVAPRRRLGSTLVLDDHVWLYELLLLDQVIRHTAQSVQ